MDINSIIAAVVGIALGLGGVAAFLAKWMPKVSGWIALAKDGVETINDISVALQPDINGKVELTAEEIAKINVDAIAFKAKLNSLLGK